MSLILTDITEGVADVRLNRPEQMNAITTDLLREIDATAAALSANDDLRCVVLRGEGRAFCAGLDKASFGGMAGAGGGGGGGGQITDLRPRTHGQANLFQHACQAWRQIPVPVVAALHGVAIGGGLQIALGADIRIAHPETRLSILEMKWGLVPDMGMTPIIRRLAPMDVVRKLTYTAEMFDAGAALGYNLVTEVAEDPVARAMALATEIAGKSPSAIRAAKRLMNVVEAQGPAEILQAESDLQMEVMGGPHLVEQIMANVQGRKPNFS